MANFFTDNEDMQFLFEHMDLARLAELSEEGFRFHDEYDFAPVDADDAIDNYRRVLTMLGELAAERIAPTAEETDRIGSRLNEDGTVAYAPGIAEAIKMLGQADLMGFTLPYKYGGINFPNLIYTMSNEIVSRADASLMNIYGLQGIADTINAYASEEIKAQYLPDMAAGKKTGAMVLTEPDAGSDLQSVKTRAYQDAQGNWYVHGVKRFITNGCGDVLLVLARTEPEISDGRGLSLLLVERGPRVKIRRLEDKLGIHGSPTCEIAFNDAPAKLIGERQRGLVTYVMSLMNGARIGIAAQSLGIGEAAFRVARDYAHSRRQFGTAIENFPALRELISDMQVDIQAARALTYFATYCVDIEIGALKKLEYGPIDDEQERKHLRTEARRYKRINAMLTPMSKYYSSEMCMRVANGAIAVMGGSGYMRDYPLERHLRDSRITTIYEGTTQLQIVAAVRGVCSGTAANVIDMLIDDRDWPNDLIEEIEKIRDGKDLLNEAIAFVKDQGGVEYMDLMGRRLTDMAIYLIVAALFADQATAKESKKVILHRWLATKMPELKMNHEFILSGERSPMTDFEILAGPLPVVE
ncbi:MAG: acyl-CoA dehydrogenase family protein [Planctomycetes bacterium]|nr:acyl-CoA dehydrogenase family protein [Planctomycetota bacterium]